MWTPPPVLAPPVVTHLHCRACPHSADTRLQPLLDLGPLDPLAFPTDPLTLPHPPVPIDIRRCPRCSLVQLSHTIPTDWRYLEYWYRSGTNDVMVAELTDVVESLRRRGVGRDEREVVLDLGANDGTLLEAWARTKTHTTATPYRIAVEPAPNLYEALAPRADVVYQSCFPGVDREVFEALDHRCAAVTAIAMLYAQDDPVGFLRAVARVLAPDGWAVMQFQDLHTVLATGQIDYFCHEHLLTLGAYSLAQLAHAAGLVLVDVEDRPVNGGSLRCYLRHRTRYSKPVAADGHGRVLTQIDHEAEAGLTTALSEDRACAPWDRLALQAETLRQTLQRVVGRTLDAGGEVDLYGASTKGQILAQLCGLGAGQIRQVWERSVAKVGRYYGGSGIPIVSEARGRKVPPATLLPLIWQFGDAVIAREKEYLRGGGTIFLPLPSPRWVTIEAGAVTVREEAAA